MIDFFKKLYDLLLELKCLDRVLLIILLLSLLCKAIWEIVCWNISKYYNKDKKHILPCVYLETTKKHNHNCKMVKYKEKYFINECCNKSKCPGYRTSNYFIDEIKSISKWPFIVLTVVKWISDLSAVVLIIRTLFNSNIV